MGPITNTSRRQKWVEGEGSRAQADSEAHNRTGKAKADTNSNPRDPHYDKIPFQAANET